MLFLTHIWCCVFCFYTYPFIFSCHSPKTLLWQHDWYTFIYIFQCVWKTLLFSRYFIASSSISSNLPYSNFFLSLLYILQAYRLLHFSPFSQKDPKTAKCAAISCLYPLILLSCSMIWLKYFSCKRIYRSYSSVFTFKHSSLLWTTHCHNTSISNTVPVTDARSPYILKVSAVQLSAENACSHASKK